MIITVIVRFKARPQHVTSCPRLTIKAAVAKQSEKYNNNRTIVTNNGKQLKEHPA